MDAGDGAPPDPLLLSTLTRARFLYGLNELRSESHREVLAFARDLPKIHLNW